MKSKVNINEELVKNIQDTIKNMNNFIDHWKYEDMSDKMKKGKWKNEWKKEIYNRQDV